MVITIIEKILLAMLITFAIAWLLPTYIVALAAYLRAVYNDVYTGWTRRLKNSNVKKYGE